MYKGKVGQGIAWLICTIIGYAMLIVPGIVMHLICIFHAATMEPAHDFRPDGPVTSNDDEVRWRALGDKKLW
jgi:hypothetical protein